MSLPVPGDTNGEHPAIFGLSEPSRKRLPSRAKVRPEPPMLSPFKRFDRDPRSPEPGHPPSKFHGQTTSSASEAPGPLPLFRPGFLEAHRRSGPDGDVLRILPPWITGVYWALAAAFLAGIAVSLLCHVTEYAEGPAVLRDVEAVELTALTPGTVQHVFVSPNDPVTAGQPLVQFNGQAETMELTEVERAFDAQLLRLLRDPSRSEVRARLADLKSQKDLAQARLDSRTMRAPVSGYVRDVRIRSGLRLAAGDPVISLTKGRSGYQVLAFLPGSYLPDLKEGCTLRLEIGRQDRTVLDLPVEGVAPEVLGPRSAGKLLGSDLADTVPLSGSRVVVRTTLSPQDLAPTTGSKLFTGMQAWARIPVGRQRLIASLLPGLRKAH